MIIFDHVKMYTDVIVDGMIWHTPKICHTPTLSIPKLDMFIVKLGKSSRRESTRIRICIVCRDAFIWMCRGYKGKW